MIDTHAHIYLPEYGNDKCAVVDRALAANVELMILPGVDASSIAPIKELHALRPEATAMCLGLHPTEVHSNDWQEQLATIERELRSGATYVGIGETGLDLYWDQTTLREQREAFEAQICLADALNLPLVIHCREAMEETLDVLAARRGRLPNAVFHCYSGTANDVARLRRLLPDVKFGIGGVVTFKKSQLPDILPTIGLNHILLETDAPWMAPTPHRGKQNESAYIPFIAQKIADTLGVTIDEVDRVTTAAARSLFPL